MRERSPQEVEREVQALAGRGLAAAGRYLANEIRRVVSVPAPYVMVRPRSGGQPYPRATTPATPGAPPRKLTGRLRAAVGSWQPDDATVRVGVQRVVYARPLETWMGHPYLVPTLRANLENLSRIVGQAVQTGGNV